MSNSVACMHRVEAFAHCHGRRVPHVMLPNSVSFFSLIIRIAKLVFHRLPALFQASFPTRQPAGPNPRIDMRVPVMVAYPQCDTNRAAFFFSLSGDIPLLTGIHLGRHSGLNRALAEFNASHQSDYSTAEGTRFTNCERSHPTSMTSLVCSWDSAK